jgi:hypothetical protein
MDSNLVGNIITTHIPLPNLQQKVDNLCDVILYNLAFNSHINFLNDEFIMKYLLIYIRTRSMRDLSKFSRNHIDIKHYMCYVKKYLNIKYNYTSLLGILGYNYYLSNSNYYDHLYINDALNMQI